MPGFLVKKENNRNRCNNLQQDKIQIPCSGEEEENILSRIQKNGINRNIERKGYHLVNLFAHPVATSVNLFDIISCESSNGFVYAQIDIFLIVFYQFILNIAQSRLNNGKGKRSRHDNGKHIDIDIKQLEELFHISRSVTFTEGFFPCGNKLLDNNNNRHKSAQGNDALADIILV